MNTAKQDGTLYDPPSGWRYGFPRPYLPLPGETLAETLLRDGYPQREIDNGGAKHCRFIGSGARSLAASVGAVVTPANDSVVEVLTTYPPKQRAPAQEHSAPANDNAPVRERYAGPSEASVYEEPHKPESYAQAAIRRGPYISTFTGRFYMTDPRPDDFTIEDVAHGLSNICRYTGACRRRYSVAEHSVLITRWLREQGASTDEQLCGLLHDAPEALSGFGDVARPAKQLAPIIRETEERIWRLAVAPRYKLPLELPAIVHEADNRIIADEMAQNMREVDPAYFEPLGVTLQFWTPEEAEAAFGDEFWRTVESGRI